MTKGLRIAEGRTAEVFAWGDSQILKLFRSWCPASLAEQEANAAQAVQRTGLSVPSVAGLIKVDGRSGIVYERITGSSMFREFLSRPWKLIHYARLLAELHTSMHTHQVSGLPPLRQRLERRIRSVTLSTRIEDAALSALDRLPDGHALCHGDFHPDNILMTSRGPVIIDWLPAERRRLAALIDMLLRRRQRGNISTNNGLTA